MKYSHRLLLLFGLVVFSAGATEDVLAHASPMSYEPGASTIVEKAPERVQIHFSEPVERKASSITIFNPQGDRLDGVGVVDAFDPRYYSVDFTGQDEGTYTVSWQVVSTEDGHFSKGAFSFSVAREIGSGVTNGAESFVVHGNTGPEAFVIWLEIIGQALFLAGLLFLVFLWRPLRRDFSSTLRNDESVATRYTYLFSLSFVFVLIGTFTFIFLKTSELQSLQGQDILSTLGVYLTTTTGQLTLARTMLGILFFGVFWFSRKQIFSSEKMTKAEIVLSILVLLAIYLRAKVSHASASHFAPDFSVLVNFVHLVGKELWVGGLVFMATVFLPAIARVKNSVATGLALVLFSRVTTFAFGIAGASGVYVTWLHLKHFGNIFTTDWGLRFIVLSLFGGVFFALRLWQQLFLDDAGLPAKHSRVKAAFLGLALPLEMLVGLALLFSTSIIIITSPPLSHWNSFEKVSANEGALVRLTEHPFETGQVSISFVDEKSGQPLEIKNAVVTLKNNEKNIGPLVAPIKERAVGTYVVPAHAFSPPGIWSIDVTGQRVGAYDVTAGFEIDFPHDVDVGRESDERAFKTFEMIMVAVALGILIFALALFMVNQKLYAAYLDALVSGHVGKFLPPSLGARVWVTALFLVLVVVFLVFGGESLLLQSRFMRSCKLNEHAWTSAAPMRDGKITAQFVVTGCTIGSGQGQFHFGNEAEYRFFLRPTEAVAVMDVSPTQLVAGVPSTLIFGIQDSEGNPVKDLVVGHDRLLHTIIVSEDFDTFAHVHAEGSYNFTEEVKERASFPVYYTFPEAGRYLVAIDFVVRARHFSKQFMVEVAGDTVPLEQSQTLVREKEFDGYTVQLASPPVITRGATSELRYTIGKDGQQLTDLEAFLSAPMHIAVVESDLGSFSHAHGELPRTFVSSFLGGGTSTEHSHSSLVKKFGPNIEAYIVFPTAGTYELFGEFQHQGKVVVTHFTVNVEE